MKVAHLIKSLGRGGAESLLPQTIAARGEGFDYCVGYFLPWKDALVAELEAADIDVRLFPATSSGRMLLRVPAVANWLRTEKIDLLHCHLPLAGVVGRLAGRLAGVPVVYTEHNLQERYHPLTGRANRLTWTQQKAVVAVSGEVASSIARTLPKQVPVKIVLNGINVERIAAGATETARKEVRESLALPEDASVVGAVAVFRTQKRFDLWLEAARSILDRDPNTYFLLVGDGPLRQDLEERTRQLGLEERVRFPGLQHDARPYFAAMDVFLISSEFEGLPLALLEAMSARLPVVTTPAGGIPEVITDECGVLVTMGDASAMADACLSLFGDPPRRKALGIAARERVEQGFSVARMARELEALYAQVV